MKTYGQSWRNTRTAPEWSAPRCSAQGWASARDHPSWTWIQVRWDSANWQQQGARRCTWCSAAGSVGAKEKKISTGPNKELQKTNLWGRRRRRGLIAFAADSTNGLRTRLHARRHQWVGGRRYENSARVTRHVLVLAVRSSCSSLTMQNIQVE